MYIPSCPTPCSPEPLGATTRAIHGPFQCESLSGDGRKKQAPWQEFDKASGKLDIALGKVPILEVGDFSLPQSKAIERYLARKLGMMGDSEEEEALVDAVAEHVRDINDELQKKWYEEELPDWLSKLEKALPGSGGFAVGSKASLADVVIFKLLKDTYPDDVSAAYDACPKIKAIVEGIEKNEGIKKWLEERPKTFI